MSDVFEGIALTVIVANSVVLALDSNESETTDIIDWVFLYRKSRVFKYPPFTVPIHDRDGSENNRPRVHPRQKLLSPRLLEYPRFRNCNNRLASQTFLRRREFRSFIPPSAPCPPTAAYHFFHKGPSGHPRILILRHANSRWFFSRSDVLFYDFCHRRVTTFHGSPQKPLLWLVHGHRTRSRRTSAYLLQLQRLM